MRWNDRIGRRIKLSDLHVLLSVVQSGSMAKAAAELAISHPAVSRSIGDLEHALGVRLLERNPKGVVVTEYGKAVLNRSHAAFDELRQAVKDIEFLADPGIGEVRIGSTPPLAATFASTVIDRLRRRFPRIVFNVVSANVNVLRRELDERTVDLLIVREIGSFSESVSFEVLYDNPYCVIAGAESPWSRRRVVQLADLVNESWVLPPPGGGLGTLVRDIFEAAKLPFPQAAVLSYGLEMIVNLVATGRYLAIQPESVLTFPVKHPLIRKVPVKFPIASGPIGVLTLKNRVLSPAARLFIEYAREVANPFTRAKR
jgi:DNA-binding transcriptional LysR family regulator